MYILDTENGFVENIVFWLRFRLCTIRVKLSFDLDRILEFEFYQTGSCDINVLILPILSSYNRFKEVTLVILGFFLNDYELEITF